MTDGDDPQPPRRVSVYFGVSRDGDAHGECPVVSDDLTVSLGNLVGVRDSIEGWQCHVAETIICQGSGFEVTVPPTVRDPDSALVLADHLTSQSIPLGDALVERSITPIGVPDWQFHWNQTVQFRWSPATDLPVLTRSRRAYFVRQDGTSIALPADSCTVSGADTIACTMPSGDTAIGSFSIELSGDTERLAVLRVARHSAQIAP